MEKKKKNRSINTRVRKVENMQVQLAKQTAQHFKMLQQMNEAIYKWSATTMPMVELGLQSTAVLTLLLEKEIITEDEIQETLKQLHDNAQKVMAEENATAETETDSGKGDTEEADSATGE